MINRRLNSNLIHILLKIASTKFYLRPLNPYYEYCSNSVVVVVVIAAIVVIVIVIVIVVVVLIIGFFIPFSA